MTIVKAEPRIDSRLLAKILCNQHQAAMALIERYADKFKTFGQLPFQKEVGASAAGGFAGAVVNVLEIGMANLPEFERKAR